MKSAKRNSAEGTLDRLVGRLMERFGRKPPTKAKGKAARARGTGRRQTARTKKAAR